MKLSGMFLASRSAQRIDGRRLLPRTWLLAFLIVALHASPAKAQDAVVLVGSGSSVPAPLYNRWTQEYAKRSAKILFLYVPIGTSEGIKEITRGASDFGAGEAQLTEKEKKDGGLIQLPVVLIGIVPIYNLADAHQELKLSGTGRDLSRRY